MTRRLRGGTDLAMGRSAVFLDRDGVLNAAVVVDGLPHPPRDRGRGRRDARTSPDACRALRLAGFMLVVVTNQPDLARGTATRRRRRRDQPLRAQTRSRSTTCAMCPHDDVDDCQCRKPRPGLLLDAAAEHGHRPARRAGMVGDRWRDVDAGRAAGCRTIFIDRGYAEPPPATPDPRRRVRWPTRPVSSSPNASRRHRDVARSTREDVRRRRRPEHGPQARGRPVDRGLHHQPHADAQGRHRRLRGVRARVHRHRARSPDLVRGVRRRARRDGTPGPADRRLGRERLREDPGHDHATALRPRRWCAASPTTACSRTSPRS